MTGHMDFGRQDPPAFRIARSVALHGMPGTRGGSTLPSGFLWTDSVCSEQTSFQNLQQPGSFVCMVI